MRLRDDFRSRARARREAAFIGGERCKWKAEADPDTTPANAEELKAKAKADKEAK